MVYISANGLTRIISNNLKKYFSSSAIVAEPKEKIEVQSKIQRINPLTHPDYFNVANMFTVRDLLEARVHFGR
jgi:hypothetical protein